MNIVRDSTNVLVGDAATGDEVTAAVCSRSADDNHIQIPLSFMVLVSPATTSATTYKVQIRVQTSEGPITMNTSHNQPNVDYTYGSVTISTITVSEIKQ